jgi:hypothetical protein
MFVHYIDDIMLIGRGEQEVLSIPDSLWNIAFHRMGDKLKTQEPDT